MAVCEVGGCNFLEDVRFIISRELLGHVVTKILIVTDHDDDTECNQRLDDIVTGISLIHDVKAKVDQSNEKHIAFTVNSQLGVAVIGLLFVEIPLDSRGSLETLILDCMCKPADVNPPYPDTEYIKQKSRKFVQNLDKNKCLKSRREQIKAPLGVAVALLNPERGLYTMKQLIASVDFEKLEDHKELSLIAEFIRS